MHGEHNESMCAPLYIVLLTAAAGMCIRGGTVEDDWVSSNLYGLEHLSEKGCSGFYHVSKYQAIVLQCSAHRNAVTTCM